MRDSGGPRMRRRGRIRSRVGWDFLPARPSDSIRLRDVAEKSPRAKLVDVVLAVVAAHDAADRRERAVPHVLGEGQAVSAGDCQVKEDPEPCCIGIVQSSRGVPRRACCDDVDIVERAREQIGGCLGNQWMVLDYQNLPHASLLLRIQLPPFGRGCFLFAFMLPRGPLVKAALPHHAVTRSVSDERCVVPRRACKSLKPARSSASAWPASVLEFVSCR